ncbi:PD-(D/E)XK nuclease family protein [bacterium]|nr:PD-(D/E)XK nuclease family protein [bacterium]
MFNHVDHGYTLTELEADTTDNGRFYTTPSGEILPSITTVLSVQNKSGLDAWRKRVGEEEANRVMNQASLRGTAVHQLAEDYVNNEKDWKKGAMPANLFTFNTIKPLLDKHLNNVWIQEAPLYSERLSVAGRVDCIAEWDGVLSIIDYKTSKRPKPRKYVESYFIQEAAYAAMFLERTGVPIKQIVTVIAVDDNEPQVYIEKAIDHLHKFVELRKKFKEQRGI